MGTVTRATRRRLEEEKGLLDRISCLPDAILGEIVSLLPTKDGCRTQVLSSRWRKVWRSAPLNIDLDHWSRIPLREISLILSSHRGPGRRFSISEFFFLNNHIDHPAAILDGWLRSPALDNLQELEFDYGHTQEGIPKPPLPLSVHRFSPTLRVVSFCGCGGFPDGGNDANAFQLPVLKQLGLSSVSISDSSLRALLTGCPVVESLLLYYTDGWSCIRIMSPSLRSIGIAVKYWGAGDSLQQVIIEDAPSLYRVLLFRYKYWKNMAISVISAPKLDTLGPLNDDLARLQFGATIFQGSCLVNLMTLVPSVKVLALSQTSLCLDVVINFMKCFPCLETLYVKAYGTGEKNTWSRKYRDLVGTIDIRLKKIVLTYYRGNKSHVDFAKFFVLNARVLRSMMFETPRGSRSISNEWIEKQHRRLQTENRASRGALFDFVCCVKPGWLGNVRAAELAHDLSTADPFVRLNEY